MKTLIQNKKADKTVPVWLNKLFYVHKLKPHSLEGDRSLLVLILDHPENLKQTASFKVSYQKGFLDVQKFREFLTFHFDNGGVGTK